MLPSLKALQALEAAARTGSFVAAAQELSITPAAISASIRALEAQMGRQLFLRTNRRIVPTEAAHEILPRLHTAFQELSSVSRQLGGSAPPARLTVSVPPSVALGWLSTNIHAFLDDNPDLAISIRSDEDPVVFERDRIDVRMSFGRFHYRDQVTTEVLADSAYAVCSPDFARRHALPAAADALLRVPLIHTDWGQSAATFPAWQRWFDTAGLGGHRRSNRGGLTVNSSKVALDLAIGGLGVALIQGLLVADMVERQELVIPVPQRLLLSQPYCLSVSELTTEREPVVAFEQWFRRECERCVSRLEAMTEALPNTCA